MSAPSTSMAANNPKVWLSPYLNTYNFNLVAQLEEYPTESVQGVLSKKYKNSKEDLVIGGKHTLQISSGFIKEIGNFFANNSDNFCNLSFTNCIFATEVWNDLCEELKNMLEKGLKSLSFKSCLLSAQQLQQLFEIDGISHKLEHIGINHQTLTNEHLTAIATYLKANQVLKSLSLKCSNIDDTILPSLVDGIKNSHLEQLFLPRNKIGNKGAKTLVENMPNSLSLVSLFYNNVKNIGALNIARALEKNDQHGLTSLGLKGNDIGNSGAVALLKIPKFKFVDLSKNKSINGVGPLYAAISNPNLNYTSLSKTGINETSIIKLQKKTFSKKCLQRDLKLELPCITSPGWKTTELDKLLNLVVDTTAKKNIHLSINYKQLNIGEGTTYKTNEKEIGKLRKIKRLDELDKVLKQIRNSQKVI